MSDISSINGKNELQAIAPDLYEAIKKDEKFLENFEKFLKRADVLGMKGRQRLIIVCQNYKRLTFEQAYHLLDPDGFRDEVERTQPFKFWLRCLTVARIFFSLTPLILTWWALSNAASSYQNYMSNHRYDSTPFLLLWQQGFKSSSWFTFSTVAFIDVVLLSLFLTTTIWALILEYNVRHAMKDFVKTYDEIITKILVVVQREGVNPVINETNVGPLAEVVRLALGNLIKDIKESINKTSEETKNLFTNQIQPTLEKFDESVGRFHAGLMTLATEAIKMTEASRSLAASADSMSVSASQMADSSIKLDKSAQNIDIHIVDLKQTEDQMINRIETAQKRVVDTINNYQEQSVREIQKSAAYMDDAAGAVSSAAGAVSSAASAMNNAINKLEQVVQPLTTLTPERVQNIAKIGKDFAEKVQKVIEEINDNLPISAEKIEKAAGKVEKAAEELRQVNNQNKQKSERGFLDWFHRKRPRDNGQ